MYEWLIAIFAAPNFVTGLLGTLIGVTAFPFLKSFFGESGKSAALRRAVGDLQEQLKVNTEITRSIEGRFSREDHLWKSELEFRQKQLAGLYGPAYGYVMSQRDIVELWLDQKMQLVNHEVKKLLSRQNQVLRDLIIDNVHLIDGTKVPESFYRFFSATLVFDLYATPTDNGYVPDHLRTDPRTAYPVEFDKHIIETAERLKARIEALHAQYAQPLQGPHPVQKDQLAKS